MDYVKVLDSLRDRAIDLERQRAVLEESLATAEKRMESALKRLAELGLSTDSLKEHLDSVDAELSQKVETFFEQLGVLNTLLRKVVSREATEEDTKKIDAVLKNIASIYESTVGSESAVEVLPESVVDVQGVQEEPGVEEPKIDEGPVEVVEEGVSVEDNPLEEVAEPEEEKEKEEGLDDFDLGDLDL